MDKGPLQKNAVLTIDFFKDLFFKLCESREGQEALVDNWLSQERWTRERVKRILQNILYEPFHLMIDSKGIRWHADKSMTLPFKQLPFLYANVFRYIVNKSQELFGTRKMFETGHFVFSQFMYDEQSDVFFLPEWKRQMARIVCLRVGKAKPTLVIMAIQDLLYKDKGVGDTFLANLHQGLQGRCTLGLVPAF